MEFNVQGVSRISRKEPSVLKHQYRWFFISAPGGARFSRVQVPSLPGSGKGIVEGKGVYREVESEGSRMWGTY